MKLTSPDNPGNSPLMDWIHYHRDYRGKECLYWPHGRNSAGYAIYGRGGKLLYVHRYMCEYRHGPCPKGHQAAHSCGNGDKGCCNPQHISWKTPSANQHDRRTTGRPFTGRREILTPVQIAVIRASDDTAAELAKMFDTTEANIRHIRAGRTRKLATY